MEDLDLKLYVKPLMEIIPIKKNAVVVTSCSGTDCACDYDCEEDCGWDLCECDGAVCRSDGCDTFECEMYDCGDDWGCTAHCPGVG